MQDRWTNSDGSIDLRCGDCRDVMATLGADSVDAIVTDPPYGLSFMGKGWDRGVPGSEFWTAALRVAKPGAHLLAFGGTRTHHRLMCAIEDAGWEIRDVVMWVYGSGFPKSLDVSKAIDKAAGAVRAQTAPRTFADGSTARRSASDFDGSPREQTMETAPATDAAKQWQGWGTALTPAYEIIVLARKPLAGTVAENVQRFGTGAINVDGCRVRFAGDDDEQEAKQKNAHADFGSGPMTNNVFGEFKKDRDNWSPRGRFPANLIHDGSDEVVGLFPAPHGAGAARDGSNNPIVRAYKAPACYGVYTKDTGAMFRVGDTGSAARFFYCAKASRSEREQGLGGIAAEQRDPSRSADQPSMNGGDGNPYNRGATPVLNCHPTVKPIALMRYLCRLVTRPGGVVLDPFMGSGSTGRAALCERMRFVGIELYEEYFKLSQGRIAGFVDDDCDDDNQASAARRQMTLF